MAPERLTSDNVSVLVLAGGKSARMGTEKALVSIDGESMLSRVVRASSHLGPTWIVGGEPTVLAHIRHDSVDGIEESSVEHVQDEVPGAGPFAALTSALSIVKTSETLVLSCDLAYPNPSDLDLLIDARRSGNADIAVPLVAGQRQWHGLAIATRIEPLLRQAHDCGIRSLRRGLVGCSEVVVCSSSPDFFRDVDTPDDLEDVRASVGGSK